MLLGSPQLHNCKSTDDKFERIKPRISEAAARFYRGSAIGLKLSLTARPKSFQSVDAALLWLKSTAERIPLNSPCYRDISSKACDSDMAAAMKLAASTLGMANK
jgi:hypothetical protein